MQVISKNRNSRMSGKLRITATAVYNTDRHASVNVVYDSLQYGRPLDQKRTEQNLVVRSGKSEAEVDNNSRLRSYCTVAY